MSAIQQALASFGGVADALRKTTTSSDYSSGGYLARGANMTGVADSAAGTLSVWVRIDAATAGMNIFCNQNGYFTLGLDSNKRIQFFAANPTYTSYVGIIDSTIQGAGATWRHILASWNMNGPAGGKGKSLLVDGVYSPLTLYDTGAASVCDYTRGNWYVAGPAQYYDGCISELYFAPGVFLDFNIPSNLLKFRNASGFPVDLGADGSLPTGFAPAVYLPSGSGTNLGYGGAFTQVAGAVVEGSTSP